MSAPPQAPSRIIGRHGDPRRGPTVLVVGGLHGNEPAGIRAIEAVLGGLRAMVGTMNGHFIGVIGNRTARIAGRRFMHRDLNRGWSATSAARVRDAAADECPEDAEQRELLRVFDEAIAVADGPVVFIDLHSTSGPASPFSIAPDLLRNRPLAATLPIPTVLGLEEIIDGTMLGYLCELGHLGLAIEGGQHQAPDTAALLEDCIWFCLATLGTVRPEQVPDRHNKLRRLQAAAADSPTLVEIKHRHGVAPGDEFVMRPGYGNFSSVAKGELVAHDRHGPIRSPRAGLMMLPRYQDEGDDGYFVASPVTHVWLRVSKAARLARLDHVLHLLPGVRRRGPDALSVRGNHVPEYLLSVLHLLGYRGRRPHAKGHEFFRRRRG